MAKTKALISCAVPAQLICVFVFAYADCWFSQEAAHIILVVGFNKTIIIMSMKSGQFVRDLRSTNNATENVFQGVNQNHIR